MQGHAFITCMRLATFASLFLLLIGLPPFAGARDQSRTDVEKLLRDNGLLPRSRPSSNTDGNAIEVRGPGQTLELVASTCRADVHGKTSLKGRRFSYQADNKGEFGGALLMRDGNGTAKAVVEGNVRALIAFEDDLYVFTGLDHLGLSYGAVDVIEDFDSNPRQKHLTRLPASPSIIAPDPNWGGFLIVSPLSISVVSLNGRLDMIMARHAYLPGANSVKSLGDADILVGLCGGVAWIHAPWRMNRPPDPADEIPVVTYWTRP